MGRAHPAGRVGPCPEQPRTISARSAQGSTKSTSAKGVVALTRLVGEERIVGSPGANLFCQRTEPPFETWSSRHAATRPATSLARRRAGPDGRERHRRGLRQGRSQANPDILGAGPGAGIARCFPLTKGARTPKIAAGMFGAQKSQSSQARRAVAEESHRLGAGRGFERGRKPWVLGRIKSDVKLQIRPAQQPVTTAG